MKSLTFGMRKLIFFFYINFPAPNVHGHFFIQLVNEYKSTEAFLTCQE